MCALICCVVGKCSFFITEYSVRTEITKFKYSVNLYCIFHRIFNPKMIEFRVLLLFENDDSEIH